MPGDPRQCRVHAPNCRAVAAQASNPTAKDVLTDLADHFDRLATEWESAENFIRAMATIEQSSNRASSVKGKN